MTTTIHHLIKQLKKLAPNTRISLCGEEASLYLYQQTDNKGEIVYTLDHGDFTRDGHGAILLHDFRGIEPPTKRWAKAIAKRIVEEPEALYEHVNEIDDPELQPLLSLLQPDGKPYPRAKTVKLLMANSQFIYQLIGTSVIEEGYFDDLN
jgi:hypothetical protein